MDATAGTVQGKRGMRMQERYLFRAKRKDFGEWVFGGLAYCEKNGAYFITKMGKDHISYIGYSQEVDPDTICQCTGLKDKNGNLIWENDIVAYWDSYSTESGLAEADCIGKVVWDDETISFQVTNRLSAESYEVLGDECSVIGNVFDNPELLEE